jgi:prolyl oligopeptidase
LIREIKLPGVGTAGGFSGKKKEKPFSRSNYITPGSIFSLDTQTGTSVVYEKPKVDFNTDLYESKQVFYTSKTVPKSQ